MIKRHFTTAGWHPAHDVEWETRVAEIKDHTGEGGFRQEGVAFPKHFSQRATNIVSSKYFYGDVEAGNGSPGDGKREHSFLQLCQRVVAFVVDKAIDQGLVEDDGDSAQSFYDELMYLLLHQKGSFNSPVWFNVGLHHFYGIKAGNEIYGWMPEGVEEVDSYVRPQASACFITGIEDDTDAIFDVAAMTSARLFKYGSGVGGDWSQLRSTKDKLSGGGSPSGPVSFMKVQDTTAGTIKSGGKTRRAAIMQTLKCWHPDVRDFVLAKQGEEKKAWALIEQGYDGSFNGDAYGSVAFQNVNQSLRVTDEFMIAATAKDMQNVWYNLTSPATEESFELEDAGEILRLVAEGTHLCGDPGMQYEDTIQQWNPVKESGEQNSTNPCSEFSFLDDTACNLASLNLKAFWDGEDFDIEGYRHAARVFLTAMEVLVDAAGYPTAKIAQNSHDFRPLGLGFANLGALLMSMGLPYDSHEGRGVAGALMGILHGEANCHSERMARKVGGFPRFEENRKPFTEVLYMHMDAAQEGRAKYADRSRLLERLWSEAVSLNRHVYHRVKEGGAMRNAQVTVLAPTGTISFMMDCDTTGIEPTLGLVQYKLLAGKSDATIKMVNHTVKEALERLGYEKKHSFGSLTSQARIIKEYIEENDTIVGAPYLEDEHLPVFATSFGTENTISWTGHVEMMAACQPFISGAISKTVNMPEDATVEEIREAYVYGWKKGLKALAIYRDNSKRSQPVSVTAKEYDAQGAVHLNFLEQEAEDRAPLRRRLPDERSAIAHKFSVAGHEGYLHVGLFEDGKPGELFVRMAKEGSTISGLMDAFATSVSLCFQYGVPVDDLVRKFTGMKFEPAGFTQSEEIRMASSLVDYIFRWLGLRFGEGRAPEPVFRPGREDEPDVVLEDAPVDVAERMGLTFTGDLCTNCGSPNLVPSGACKSCRDCGETTGCG